MAKELTSANFNQVLDNNSLVLVDFWAQWCGPCRALAPVIEKASVDFAADCLVGKLNVDDSGDIAERYNIMAIPTIVLFKNGKEAARNVGSCSLEVIGKLINENK